MAVENKDSNGMERNRKEIEKKGNRVKQRSRERKNKKVTIHNPVGCSLDMVYIVIWFIINVVVMEWMLIGFACAWRLYKSLFV